MAKSFADNTQCKSKMKHINMKWNWVKDLRDQEVVKLDKIDGAVNLADALTKIQNNTRFKELNDMLKATRN